MRRSLTFALLGVVLFSCSKDTTGPKLPIPPIVRIVPESAVVDLFDTLRLRAIVLDSAGDTLNLLPVWTSADANKVFVNSGGRVEGLNRATVQITATVGDGVGHASIRVKINVITVQLTPRTGTPAVGDTVRMHASLFTADGLPPDDSIVAWRSSDTAKATVSATGLVTARAQGPVTISGQVDSAVGTAAFSIPEPVTTVRMSAHLDTLRQDSLFHVTVVTLGPANDTLTNTPVTWTSSDTSVAKLSTSVFDANIGAYAPGRAVVRATAGHASDSCVVIVVRPSVATVHVIPGADTLLSDSSATLVAVLRDSVGDTLRGRLVSWSSSDTAVAVIDTAGRVTAHRAGTTHVRASVEGKSDSAQIVSIRPTVANIAVTPDSGHLLTWMTDQLTASLTDSVGDTLVRPVTWSSLSPSVATVSSAGLVTAIAAGSAAIRGTVDSKMGSATFQVDTVFGHPLEVTAGEHFNCALVSGGSASCWGYNAEGQTGHSPNGQPCDTMPSCAGTPVVVTGGLSFASIVAGGTHTCGLTAGGQAYCWGEADFGESGNGPTVPCATGQCTQGPVAVPGGLTFLSLAAGQVTTCGIAVDSSAYCWGANVRQQLGGDSLNTGPHNTPIPVYGGHKFTQLALGALHTCGLTLVGSIYCWGYNQDGEVGIYANNPGATPDIAVPTQVLGSQTFVSVVAGWYHTCGLISDGTAYCWGANGYGMLGNGTTTAAWEPVAIPNGVTFATLAGGEWSTCGLTSSGHAECWGLNDNGQLGSGIVGGQSSSPTMVAGGHTFSTIAVGGYHACAVVSGGQVLCWGTNGLGQMGLGTSTSAIPTPTVVVGQP